METHLKTKSRFLSLILRHKPEAADIVLSDKGWANVKEILHKCSLKMDELEQIVETNDKKRFEFDQPKIRIRARQGHSIDVDVELSPYIPTHSLYHGTGSKSMSSILKEGIKKQSRTHVHLSDDVDTALKVGSRHGAPVILKIDAVKMHIDGFEFFKSNNDVYLTDFVPPLYITVK